jgi:hypothetical protein
MKKEELNRLIEERLTLRKRTQSLREYLSEIESRYEEVGQLLYL